MNEQNLLILNLLDELNDSLNGYFKSIDATIILRTEAVDYQKIDFILVQSEDQAQEAFNDYACDENNITLVCIGSTVNTKDFLLANGRLCVPENILEMALGKQILNKYFLHEHSIHLDESFGDMFSSKVERFSLTNHLNLGESVDRVVVDAFEKSFNLIAIRSFLDHVTFYLAYLKQAALGGIPFEVEYVGTDDYYAVNIHLAVKNFVAEYMIDSFGSIDANDSFKSLLSMAQKNCHFLDICFIEDSSKLCFTAIWGKDPAQEVRGIAFNNIKTSAQVKKHLDFQIKDYDPNLDDLDNKKESMRSKALPGGILDLAIVTNKDSAFYNKPDEASNLIAFVIGHFEEENEERKISDITEEDLKQIVKGYPDKDILTKITSEDEKDLLEKIQKKNISDAYNEEIERVRDNLKDDDDYKKVIDGELNEKVAEKISSQLDLDDLNRILGSKEKEDDATVVKGSKELADDFVQTIKGMEKEKDSDFVQSFSNNFEKAAGAFDFKSLAGEGVEKRQMQIRNLIGNSLDADIDDNVKDYIQKVGSKKIEASLSRYAEKMGESIEALSPENLKGFKEAELPTLMETVLNYDDEIMAFSSEIEKEAEKNNFTEQFQDKLKDSLEDKLLAINSITKEGEQLVLTQEDLEKEDVKKIVQSSLKEIISDSIELESVTKENLSEKEEVLIETLSEGLHIEESKVDAVVTSVTNEVREKELETVVSKLFEEKPDDDEKTTEVEGLNIDVQKKEGSSTNSLEQAELLRKLRESEVAKERLQDQLKAMKIHLDASKSTFETLEKASLESQKEAMDEIGKAKELMDDSELSEKEREEKLQELKTGSMNAEDVEKFAEALNREKEVLNLAKNAEAHVKKLELEMQKKEAIFKSEINKANRTLKAKDTVVEKAKEAMQSLVAKKEGEKKSLKEQIEDLNKKLSNTSVNEYKSNIKSLKIENTSLNKSVGLYKKKLEQMSALINKQKNNSKDNKMAEENRSLSRLKLQLEAKIKSEEKAKKSLEDRYNKSKESESKFRSQFTGLQSKMKEYESQMRQLKDSNDRLTKAASAESEKPADTKLQKELAQIKEQNTLLQEKLKEAVSASSSADNKKKSADSAPASAKEKHLEKNNKKLQEELSKSRADSAEQKKNLMKFKSENGALKNQITALKREVEKHQKKSKKAA